jgi:hypothetical protein
MSECQSKLQNNFNETLQKYHKIQCDRFDLVENTLKSTVEDVKFNAKDIFALKRQVEKLSEKLDQVTNNASSTKEDIKAVSEKVSVLDGHNSAVQDQLGLLKTPTYVAPPLDPKWERPARPEVLTIGAAKHVSKDAIKETIKKWLAPLNYTEEFWRLDGPQFGRNWDLCFHGEFASVESAALKANKANLLLRNEDGSWEHLTAQGPEQEQIDLFISKDDVPKNKREFALTKRLFKCIERSHGTNNNSIYIHKQLRCIKHKKVEFAKVECESFEKFEVKWIQAVVEDLGLNKEDILKEFHSRTGLAPGHVWTV